MINKNTQVYLIASAVVFLLLILGANSTEWYLLAAFTVIPFWALLTFGYLINKNKNVEPSPVEKGGRNYVPLILLTLYIILLILDASGSELAGNINVWFVENLIVIPVLFICAIIVVRDFFRWIRS